MSKTDSSDGKIMLDEMLSEGDILLDARSASVDEVVDAAGGLLLLRGAIGASYITGMHELLDELGPYMVLAPGIALLHARPEKGALRDYLVFLRLAVPVPFGHETNDPVDLVFAFAAVDGAAHIQMLRELAYLLGDEHLIAKLRAATSADDALMAMREGIRAIPPPEPTV